MTKRNNEERLGMPSHGAKEAADAPSTYVEPEQRASLAYVAPTHLVELPSEGKFYPEGHPLYNVREIELKEMTAKEEDILTSQSLIKKGIVFDRLLTSLLIDKSIRLDDLLIGDKNALLIAARISGYGADYTINMSCPMCDTKVDHVIDLAQCPTKEPIDFTSAPDDEMLASVCPASGVGTFLVNLPRSKVTVEVRLLTGRDEKRNAAVEESRKKQNLPEAALTEHFRSIIVSVDGVDQAADVRNFIDNMPALDPKFLRKVFSKLTPNIEMKQEFVCSECLYEQDLEVPFTAQFFWPD